MNPRAGDVGALAHDEGPNAGLRLGLRLGLAPDAQRQLAALVVRHLRPCEGRPGGASDDQGRCDPCAAADAVVKINNSGIRLIEIYILVVYGKKCNKSDIIYEDKRGWIYEFVDFRKYIL